MVAALDLLDELVLDLVGARDDGAARTLARVIWAELEALSGLDLHGLSLRCAHCHHLLLLLRLPLAVPHIRQVLRGTTTAEVRIATLFLVTLLPVISCCLER